MVSVAAVLAPPRNREGFEDDQPEAPPPVRPVPLGDSPLEPVSVPHTPRRVLLVDDDAAVRETLGEILEQEGYEVTRASDGQEALFLLVWGSVDVLVLDLAMPGYGGLWLLNRLGPAMPTVIVYSAFEYVTEAEVRARAGSKVFRCLRKPVSPPALLSAVADAIRQNPR